MTESAYLLSCRPPTSSSAWTERMLSGQSTNQTTWAASDVAAVTVTRNWSSCCNVICVYWTAPWHPVAHIVSIQGLSGGIEWPSRWHWMTVLEIIIAFLHCFQQKECWPMCIRDFVLWIRSVPVSNAHVRRAFVQHIVIVPPHVTAWPNIKIRH